MHLIHILSIGIGIITKKEKTIGLAGYSRLPNKLFGLLVSTRTHRDSSI